MRKELEETIKNKLIYQPKELREVILNFDWDTITEEIIKKYQTDEEKIFKFQIETSLVLLGLVIEEEYKENIKKYIELNEEQVNQIIPEMAKRVFNPLLEKLNENIKKDLKERKINAVQNLDFILSGGNYAAFMESPLTINSNNLPQSTNDQIPESKIDEIKSKFTI